MVEENNRKKAQTQFQALLHDALIRKYAIIPSASQFADDFNLNAIGTSTVSRETTRNWINGSAFPKVDHLMVLCEWLSLSVDSIFQCGNQA